jgi:two-component sensor histidine kinase
MTSEDEDFRLEAENLDLRRLLAQAGIDAAEQKVAQKLQRIMVEELHHRVKNILATVQAIASQSLRAAQSVEEGRQAIESRLQALSRVHDLLLQTNWSKAKLGAILRAGIEPFVAPTAPQIIMRSADIDVAPAAALPLAMVLNELCTNAVKYGALSRPTGRVDLDASLSADRDSFILTWTEKGGPTVQKPTRRGFGSKLIEHAFVAQLHAKASLDFDPGGVATQAKVALEGGDQTPSPGSGGGAAGSNASGPAKPCMRKAHCRPTSAPLMRGRSHKLRPMVSGYHIRMWTQ